MDCCLFLPFVVDLQLKFPLTLSLIGSAGKYNESLFTAVAQSSLPPWLTMNNVNMSKFLLTLLFQRVLVT